VAVGKFETPLYTVAEASRYLGVTDSRFRAWAHGYTHRAPDRNEVRGEPVVTTIAGQRAGAASVPFAGLAGGLVLAGMREAGT
jgi:helix-turn-helix protein